MDTASQVDVQMQRTAVNGTELSVAVAGEGPPVLLVHGWPHTWEVWSAVLPALAADHRVLAPDLRGIGASERAAGGYDAGNLAIDLLELLQAQASGPATVVALDAGVAPAFLLAMAHPERVERLVVMEALLGRLPGAERFLAAGPPWWFGFHSVPGLAEVVLAGHEDEYIDWFLRTGMAGGRRIEPGLRDAFIAAYTGTESLRCGFEHYRAAPTNAEQIARAVAGGRLRVPTLAIAGGVVGDALHRQLLPLSDRLGEAAIEDCGHIVPLDRPEALLAAMMPWWEAGD